MNNFDRVRRFYSHYTYIYPDKFYKNAIVELTDNNRIIAIFPFEREIENTEFHSGWLFLVPSNTDVNKIDFENITKNKYFEDIPQDYIKNSLSYVIYNIDRLSINK